jgi:hypothetical protein
LISFASQRIVFDDSKAFHGPFKRRSKLPLDAINPAHESKVSRVNSPSHGIFSDISFSLLSSRETKETDVGLETLRLAHQANSQPCLEDEQTDHKHAAGR